MGESGKSVLALMMIIGVFGSVYGLDDGWCDVAVARAECRASDWFARNSVCSH